MKKYFIRLDVQKPTDTDYIQVIKQDTLANTLYITLLNAGELIPMSEFTFVEVVADKPDATQWISSGEVLGNGQVKVDLEYQAISAVGVVDISVKLYTGEVVMTTYPFQIRVITDPNAGTDGSVESASEYPILSAMAANETGRLSAEADRENAEGLREEAETARGAAYTLAEGARDLLYGTAEGERNSDYGLAEAARDGLYDAAEVARNGLYTTAEGLRDTSYGTAEGVRDGLYTTAEGARDDLYDIAEAARDVKMGTLANLTTTEKGSIVGAVNEVVSDLTTHKEDYATRIDNIITTPVPVGEIIAQEIIDARDGEISVGAKIRKLNKGVTIVTVTDGEDATTKLQTALNGKGHIKVFGSGTVSTNRLLIDDDTKLELMPGFILKRKDNTNHYIICNRGHVYGYRNKNITVKGGHFDLNRENNIGNYGDLSTDAQSWSGIGILFNGVDNLIIEDVEEIGNEWKYCYLITDINHGIFRNINMVNESDGLHYQPPLRNILIENIKGSTQDDLISFTMGDYPRYSLGQTGDIENVICRNIYGEQGTDELIKLVGSGIDGLSVFRNMKFENLSGFSTVFAVCIMREDQAAPNPCLLNTKLENIVFENIDVKVSGAQSYFFVGAASGDITIRKLKMRQADSLRPLIFDKCNLSKVIIEDCEFIKSAGAESTNYLIRVQNPKVGESIEHLIIKDSNFKFNASGGLGLYPAPKSVKNITFENSILDGTGIQFLMFDGANTDGTVVNILNSKINCAIFCNTSEKVNIYLTNSQITTVTRTIHLVDGADIRVVSSSDIILTINGTTALRKLSINGLIKTIYGVSNYTPLEGDSFYDLTNHIRKTWNGTTWI